MTEPVFEVVFYADATGREPVADFIRGLAGHQRAALLAALEAVLARQGVGVVGTQYGKALGRGLYEFRLRHTYEEIAARFPDVARQVPAPGSRPRDPILLRVFFHPYGPGLLLLLGGYDKGRDASARSESREIAQARRRLHDFRAHPEEQPAPGP